MDSANMIKDTRNLPKPGDNILNNWHINRQLEKLLSSDKDLFDDLKTCPYKDNKFEFYQFKDDIEAKDIRNGEKLLRKWGNNGMEYRTLTYFFEMIRFERALLLLKPYEYVRIVEHPETSVDIEAGDTLVLSCKATGFPYPDYEWFLVSKSVDSADLRTVISTKHNDGVLRIPKVNETHTGNYICMVQNTLENAKGQPYRKYTNYSHVYVHPSKTPATKPSGEVKAHTTKTPVVLSGRPLITRQPEANVHLKFGDAVALVCEATDADESGYLWLKDETLIKGGIGTKYTIKSSDLFDNGKYQCVVRNEHGETTSRVCDLKVVPDVKEVLNPPHIVTHPTTKSDQIGGKVNFCIEAHSRGPLSYKWYKDNVQIKGETRNNLSFVVKSYGDAGSYQCHVLNANGGVLSQVAKFTVTETHQPYTARDKVALIIGISHYKHHQILRSVKNDVKETMEKFMQLGFKVVTLLDLTLEEMHRAITLFAELLDEGVYGLMYVAGHGFAYRGKHYLIPWDAPSHCDPEEAMCLEDEEAGFQMRKPAFLLFFVDVCRENCSHDTIKDKLSKQYDYYRDTSAAQERIQGNRAVFFAASAGERAWAEDSVSEKGKVNVETCPWGIKNNRSIFSQYLMDVITQERTIPELWMAFVQNYLDKYKHSTPLPQTPELYFNMLKKRKLTDPIYYTGDTMAMNFRTQKWIRAHELPPRVQFKVENLDQFEVSYSMITSNIMEVEFKSGFVPAVKKWRVKYLEESVPSEIKPIKYVVDDNTEEDKQELTDINTSIRLRIAHLQRLQSPLVLHFVLKLQLSMPDEDGTLPCECPVTISMGAPLVANLTYVKEKEAREQEEGDTDTV